MNARRLFCRVGPWLTVWLAVGAMPAPGAEPAVADTSSGTAAVHRLRISPERPPCSHPPGLPIVPNDPAALPGAGGRCLGTRAPELEVWLAEDRYVWLEPHAPMAAVWIDLGSVELDARELAEAPLGLRLSAAADGWTLETRYGDLATLTPLAAGAWQEVAAPDGRRFWVRVDADGPPAGDGAPRRRPLAGGAVRFRAD
ncbi:MAG TPA: hypothetical protein VF210_10330 [Pseudomonadales bacterium]